MSNFFLDMKGLGYHLQNGTKIRNRCLHLYIKWFSDICRHWCEGKRQPVYADDSAATGSQRKIANILSKSRKSRKEIFYYISCYPGPIFLTFFRTFFLVISSFLLNNFLKVKIRKKFASRKGAFLSRNQTLKFARIAKIRKVWQHWPTTHAQ